MSADLLPSALAIEADALLTRLHGIASTVRRVMDSQRCAGFTPKDQTPDDFGQVARLIEQGTALVQEEVRL